MTGDDSMSDDVFEVEDDACTVASSGLTPMGQPLTTTPSPTGYRDYKPPAEVLDDNYGYSSRDYDSVKSSFKRTKEEDTAFAHKVSLVRFLQSDSSNLGSRKIIDRRIHRSLKQNSRSFITRPL